MFINGGNLLFLRLNKCKKILFFYEVLALFFVSFNLLLINYLTFIYEKQSHFQKRSLQY